MFEKFLCKKTPPLPRDERSCRVILTYLIHVLKYVVEKECRSSKILLILLLLPFISFHLQKIHGIDEKGLTISHIIQAVGLSPTSTALRKNIIKTLADFISCNEQNLESLRMTCRKRVRKLCISCSKNYSHVPIIQFPKCRFGNHVLIVKKGQDAFACFSCGRKYPVEELKRIRYPFCRKCESPLTIKVQRVYIVYFDEMVYSSKIIKELLDFVSKRCSLCIRLDNTGGGDF